MPVILRIERAEPPGRTPLLEAAAAAAAGRCASTSAPGRAASGPSRCTRGSTTGSGRSRGGPGARAGRPSRTCRASPSRSTAPRRGRSSRPRHRDAQGRRAAADLGRRTAARRAGPDPGRRAAAAAQPARADDRRQGVRAGRPRDDDPRRAAGRRARWPAWAEQGYRTAVRAAAPVRGELHPGDDPEGAWRRDRVIAVRDAGFTEVGPGTITVLAQWAPEQAAH